MGKQIPLSHHYFIKQKKKKENDRLKLGNRIYAHSFPPQMSKKNPRKISEGGNTQCDS